MLKYVRNRNTSNKSQRGATSVEFAVIAGLLLVFLFGIIEYAMLFLQEHYVANAAREAVRIGVRANNYSGYKGSRLPNVAVYNPASDRLTIVKDAAADYLSILYDEDDVRTGTTLLQVDPDGNLATDSDRTLVVTVQVKNFATNITPELLLLLNPDSNVENPSIISASAQMELEDQAEFDSDLAVLDSENSVYSY